jgi:negative regulator of flagellin synthesis FlgM
MRIDLNQLSLGNIGREVNGKKTAGKASGPAVPEDKASFSSDNLDLPSLEAQALALPEIRQDKVDALRQAIQNGNYKVEPDKIAQAMIEQNKK